MSASVELTRLVWELVPAFPCDEKALQVVALLCGVGALAHGVLPLVSPERHVPRRLVILGMFVLQARYWIWRLTNTVPEPALSFELFFMYGFLGVEALMGYANARSVLIMWSTRSRSEEADRNANWYRTLERWPLVDIFIPTYNEPRHVVEKTIVGAQHQSYPNTRVWVLDDGKRDWLEQLCRELGVNYLRRSTNQHAKAGNLNNALEHVNALPQSPDFVAVFDADFVPCRIFVARTLALMHDQKTGIVQTPQYFFNLDPIQARFKGGHRWPDAMRDFYDEFLRALDAVDRANCCGTSFLVRVEALVKIGGIPTDAVTEDVLTSVRLRRSGFKTTYLHEQLSAGLAPEGVHEFLTQRGRWCLGVTQVALLLWRDLRSLSIWQRISIFEQMLRWPYTACLRVVFWSIPIVHWYFGVIVVQAELGDVLFYLLPVMIYQRTLQTWITRGSHLGIVSEAAHVLAWPAMFRAFFQGLIERGRVHRFVVTDKGVARNHTVVHWSVLRWYLAYVVLIGAPIVWRFATGTVDQALYLIWLVPPTLHMLVAAMTCVERPSRRDEERFATDEGVGLASAAGQKTARAIDISASGIRIQNDADHKIGERVTVELSGVGNVAAEVVRREPGVLALRFVLGDVTRRQLTLKLFSDATYVRPTVRGSFSGVVSGLVRTITA